jgi:hypothetical protein
MAEVSAPERRDALIQRIAAETRVARLDAQTSIRMYFPKTRSREAARMRVAASQAHERRYGDFTLHIRG